MDKEFKYILTCIISMFIVVFLIVAILLPYREVEKPREAYGSGVVIEYETNRTLLSFTCWADGSIEIYEIDPSYSITIGELKDNCEQRLSYKYTVTKSTEGEEDDF